uniref:PIR Superfamily Protein n=1 Tax=Strongyloides papillosus TaxID=174720 RepID=A0A0N5B501_STREA
MEQNKGNSKSFYLESRTRSFDKFIDEFHEGKYNNESKVINTLYELRKKCKKLSTYKIYDCNLEVSNFGKYALSSIFIKRNKIRSEGNGDYNIIENMIKRIKEEFRLIIDEKKDDFDEETRNNFKYKFDKMKFVRNFDKLDLSNVTSMESCYDNIGIDYNDHITNILDKMKNLKALSYNEKDSLNSCRGKLFQPYIIMKLFVYE